MLKLRLQLYNHFMVAFSKRPVYNFMGDIMSLNCENEFCIYQEDGVCGLDSISLDIMGQCTDCIYVDIESNVLKEAKQKLLNKYEISDS